MLVRRTLITQQKSDIEMTQKQQDQKQQTLARAKELLCLQRKALATERTYLQWMGSYIDFLADHGAGFANSKGRIEAFLTRIARRGCAASTQNQAFNALLYLYEQVLGEKLPDIRALRAKCPSTHRTALAKDVTLKLLEGVQDEAGYPTRLVAWLLYGCGLRVSEPLNLRVKDVEISGPRLSIRGAKGGKDRTVLLPRSLSAQMEIQLRCARSTWERDQQQGLPVEVPGELAKKYPRAPFSWQWAWVFPSRNSCIHPRTGERVRFRMHEANVQRAVKKSAEALGLGSLATPHVLRHCYATHQLDSGCNIRDLQEALGHAHVETTMGYTHASPSRLKQLI